MKIEYWSDYACPYCYIGETHLKSALKSLEIDNVEVEMKAFELNPYASTEYEGPTVDRFASKYGLSTDEAAKKIDAISQTGQSAGLSFDYANTRYTNTLDAHRLTKFAAEQLSAEETEKLSETLYDAYFAKAMELSDKNVLIELARNAGLEETEVAELLAGNKYEDEVRADERAAAMMGVHAVPYFVIDDKYAVPGALPAAEFEKVLLKALEDSRAIQMQGAACGPNGCVL